MKDPNEDLIGYEFTEPGDPPPTWRVTGSDPILGAGYVDLIKVGTEDRRIQNAAVVRRHKQIHGG